MELILNTYGVALNRDGDAHLSCRQPRLSAQLPLQPQLRKAKPGDVLSCRYRIDGKRCLLLTTRPTGRHVAQNHPAKPETKIVEGTVSIRPGQPFAFIDRIYFVPPPLRQQHSLADGHHVKAQVIKRADGKWRVKAIIS